jgi:broad specificity phosphatase PhoE
LQSQQVVTPAVPAREWHLSEIGRARCQLLADQLAALQPDLVVSSVAPKAIETAQIVAQRLGQTVQVVQGLHEHARSDIGLNAAEFVAAVARFFAKPHELVFGDETADAAYTRFASALAGVIEVRCQRTVAVITHGTVLSLFAARAAGVEPFAFWQRLGLPAFVVLTLPDLALARIVARIE